MRVGYLKKVGYVKHYFNVRNNLSHCEPADFAITSPDTTLGMKRVFSFGLATSSSYSSGADNPGLTGTYIGCGRLEYLWTDATGNSVSPPNWIVFERVSTNQP
jgi:hypothetical protein